MRTVGDKFWALIPLVDKQTAMANALAALEGDTDERTQAVESDQRVKAGITRGT